MKLIRIVNHHLVDGKERYIYTELICKSKKLYYLCNSHYQPLDKGYESIDALAKVHGKSLL